MRKLILFCMLFLYLIPNSTTAQGYWVIDDPRCELRDTNYDGYMFNKPFRECSYSGGAGGRGVQIRDNATSLFAGCRYHSDTPVTIYGVACLAEDAGILPHRLMENGECDISSDSLWGMIVQKDGDRYVGIDSAKYHNYFRPYNCYGEYPCCVPTVHFDLPSIDQSGTYHAPIIEYYFGNPVTISGTFYVGLKSYIQPLSIFIWIRGYDCYRDSIGRVFIDSNELLVLKDMERDLSNYHYMIGTGQPFNPNLAFFPIIKPYEEDSVFCDTVPNFHLVSMRMGYPTFAWDTDWFREEDLYQVQYAPYRTNDWITESTADSSIELFSVFDPTIYYQARVRARRHHRCPIHDTVMWSDWSAPILFYTGATAPDTTASLPQPLLNEGSPLFTLTPNPTTGEVTVTLGQPPLTLTHSSVSKADSWLHWRSPTFGSPNLGEQLRRLTLTIHDAAGNEVLHKELVRPGISISLDLSDLPSGTYFVTLTTSTGSGTQKLVVK